MILDKVPYTVNICGLEIDFDGYTVPSTIVDFQPFHNSIPVQNNFQTVYFGRSTIGFKEEIVESPSGIAYQQKLTFRFPSTDELRATRLEMFKKIKYVKMNLSNGLSLVIGRNDFFQNVPPKIDFNSDISKAALEISCLSISPAGFILDEAEIPENYYIPVALLNIE